MELTELLLVALAGFLASMVDGALGMGFGPTSATILLSAGLSPAATSATVNIAKVASGAAAGASHWRLGNVDRRLVRSLALPGMGGAVVGTLVLANVDGDRLRPILALLLVAVGVRILLRFSRPLRSAAGDGDEHGVATRPDRGVAVAAGTGGLTNGLVGAWGPVVTPYLLHRGVPPRVAIGSVNTAEVAVAVVAVGSLFASSRGSGVELAVVVAMLVGGVAAAPLAASVVRYLPARLLGLAVAGLLLVTQSRELAIAAWLPVDRWAAYGAVVVGVAFAVLRPRVERRLAPAPA